MSFPNIPDINPYINITFEDAINLLLTSIALEEIGLSNLIDAESNKILCVLDECTECQYKHEDSNFKNVLAINKSVDSTIKNIIKLQMLLQFKLENVTDLLPSTSTTSSTTTTTTTTTTSSTCTHTTSHTTTCTTSTCSTPAKCECSLTGSAKGSVSNKDDKFYCQTAVLRPYICSCDFKTRTLRYTVQNDADTLYLVSSGNNIKIECPSFEHSNRLVIYGKAHIEKKSKRQSVSGTANFVLKVWNKSPSCLVFEMEIESDAKPELNHNSGPVEMDPPNSDMEMEVFC